MRARAVERNGGCGGFRLGNVERIGGRGGFRLGNLGAIAETGRGAARRAVVAPAANRGNPAVQLTERAALRRAI